MVACIDESRIIASQLEASERMRHWLQTATNHVFEAFSPHIGDN